MTPRTKKLIAAVALPAWLIVYAGAAIRLADWLPDFWLAKLFYFLAAGFLWTLPVIPLMKWINNAPAAKDASK